MNLRDLLSVPYLLEAEAVETEAGKWRVRLAYPELPDCTAEGFVVEDVFKQLEQRRIEIIRNDDQRLLRASRGAHGFGGTQARKFGDGLSPTGNNDFLSRFGFFDEL